ncbi:MAG TPA: aldo/keto reductase [Steroidobacteraceae bacterium]|nr:aldo/keto reductase [Steroidobacteraceae bacterium]
MASIRTRPFGSTRRPVPLVGQGTWRADEADRNTVLAALRRGLDLGLTHIDTAEMYGSGEAERIVAEAIAGRRDEVFLVSKVLPHHASLRGTVSACEQSLARLKTDRLDGYLLHWRGAPALAETIEAFASLQRAGKILSWGVSNFDVDDLDELVALGAGLPSCNQVLYHIAERAIEHAVLPWCARRDVAVVAYTPFGVSAQLYEGRSKAARVLAEVARAHEATPRQVALAFLLRHPNTFVIPKAASPEHVAENAAAAALELDDEDIARLEAAFPRGEARALPTL